MTSKTRRQWNWADQWLDEIRSIVGQHLVQVAPLEEDQQRNADLMVTQGRERIAVRVRDADKNWQYRDELTLRYAYRGGRMTEWEKVRLGWGDLMFYGFADQDGLRQWRIIDLHALRELVVGDDSMQEGLKQYVQTNRDCVTQFMALPIVRIDRWARRQHARSIILQHWERQ